ncbi:hypothetical protein TIFTF001_016631 [Ficus carica]|uniref:Uncharacterized protein n=1 Tax=Ficus carica TaxID=3494 RepID=A0AA88D7K5_FICCA|nr:hypothetical protein TIFTF001_016631 [Ficus carica]
MTGHYKEETPHVLALVSNPPSFGSLASSSIAKSLTMTGHIRSKLNAPPMAGHPKEWTPHATSLGEQASLALLTWLFGTCLAGHHIGSHEQMMLYVVSTRTRSGLVHGLSWTGLAAPTTPWLRATVSKLMAVLDTRQWSVVMQNCETESDLFRQNIKLRISHKDRFGPWFELDRAGRPNHSMAARQGTYTYVMLAILWQYEMQDGGVWQGKL